MFKSCSLSSSPDERGLFCSLSSMGSLIFNFVWIYLLHCKLVSHWKFNWGQWRELEMKRDNCKTFLCSCPLRNQILKFNVHLIGSAPVDVGVSKLKARLHVLRSGGQSSCLMERLLWLPVFQGYLCLTLCVCHVPPVAKIQGGKKPRELL